MSGILRTDRQTYPDKTKADRWRCACGKQCTRQTKINGRNVVICRACEDGLKYRDRGDSIETLKKLADQYRPSPPERK